MGLVGPKPVPQRMIVSPGLAATVGVPKVPFLTASVKSGKWDAMGCPLGHSKNAGPYWLEVTMNVLLVPPLVATVTGREPNPTSGTIKLIWPGEMKLM